MTWDYLEHLSYKTIYLSSIFLILVLYFGNLIFVNFPFLLMNHGENIIHETRRGKRIMNSFQHGSSRLTFNVVTEQENLKQ